MTTADKNVLLVCTSFPPQSDVGALRPAMFAKYLPKYGWKPIVFTRVLPDDDPMWQPTMNIDGLPPQEKRLSFLYGTRDAEKSYKNRNIGHLLKHFFCPDFVQPSGLAEKMMSEGKKLVINEKITAVWGTYPDFGGLSATAYIAKHLNLPWIADFRDIHEQDKKDDFRTKLLHWRIFFRRHQILRSASAIVTVSKHHARILAKSFKRNVHVIQNGFDPAVFYPAALHHSDKFSIVYMGRILSEWLQNPKSFFEAIDILLNSGVIDGRDLEILFYGTEPLILGNLASEFCCRKYVRAMPRMDFKNVPEILRKSCILLALTNKDRHGILTTKVFEYIGVKRPILCVPGDGGELDDLIKNTNTGYSCPSAESAATLLKRWYEEWKKSGTVACQSDEYEIQKFSREKQAGQLASLLDSLRKDR